MSFQKILQSLCLFSFLLLSGCQKNTDGISSPEGYELAWSDEFVDEELDTSNWTPLIGNGSGGWGNNELEYYQKENATVKNGVLSIEARKEHVANFSYTSARLVTQRKVSTTYGYIEARIKLPAQNAMWPAFWMLPENGSWPTFGEIDIMENKGSSAWTTSGALHYANAGGHTYACKAHAFSQRNGDQNIEGWHTYAIEWSEDEIDWYVDGINFFQVLKRVWHPDHGTVYTKDDSAPFNAPFHIILNLAIGGNFDSEHPAPDADFESATMQVDYVRIFSKK